MEIVDLSLLGTTQKCYFSFNPAFYQITCILHFKRSHILLHSTHRCNGPGMPISLKTSFAQPIVVELDIWNKLVLIEQWIQGEFNRISDNKFINLFPADLKQFILQQEINCLNQAKNAFETFNTKKP